MREEWKAQMNHTAAFFKWLVLASAMGTAVGLVGVAFHHAVALATELRLEYPWLIWLLPVGGILIALLYKVCGLEQDRGTNLVLCAVRDNERMKLKVAPLVFIGTFLTHMLGGSSGREGAALQLGGSIASYIGHKARLDCHSVCILVVCGMSGCFSAVFGTPVTAAIFALEVVHVGVVHYSEFFPAMISALVALLVADRLGGIHTAFQITGVPAITLLSLLQVAALGMLVAALSVLFYKSIHISSHLYKKFLPNMIFRAAVGGIFIIILTLIVGNQNYNGAGMDIITAAIGGDVRPEAFALKIIFTAVTLGAGFKGGEIVPVFFTGATFGCFAGPLMGLNPSFSAALGMTALFCGVTNCPIASLLLSFELFGGAGLPLFALCCAVSYLLSGYGGLYHEQKIVFSKIRPEIYKAHNNEHNNEEEYIL